ncbi:MAG: WecB/TagA/CpsF family glycosyltransferase [Chloroflexi bacterium]|nr:MAG: WecB/TagA/CpsF family glycosyltransferase [Chloroflexota bacterium]
MLKMSLSAGKKDMSLSQINATSQRHSPEAAYVLGVRVDRLSQRQALDSIEQIIVQWRASDRAQVCQQIVTVNPEFVMNAQRNKDFRTAINAAALIVADGVGVVWATRYLGRPVPERVTGTDLLPELAQRCAAAGYRLYLLGAAPGIAEAAGARLQELAPGLVIAGTYAGSPAPNEEEEIIERVRAAHADVLCVAYGAPAQDLWIWRNLARLPVAVAIGVGGAYDFLSGRQQRAPIFLRKLGLEWLYRLYREPWRWRRMLALPRFAMRVILRGRKNHDA